MNIDLKQILEEIQEPPDRTSQSVYISDALFQRFKACCEQQDIKMSKLLERLMVYALDALERKPKKSG